MKNAHLRFGTLEFVRPMKDTTVHVRLHLDRFIGERAEEDSGPIKAHLLSVLGGDSDIAAIGAAVAEAAYFEVRGPELPPVTTTLGKDAQSYRGSISVPGRKRPVRHLVAVSAELAHTRPGGEPGASRTILCDDDPSFVLYRIAVRFGLPALPEWSAWFAQELARRKAIHPLIGLGCSPVVVKGTKKKFLAWIGHALKRGIIDIPDQAAAVTFGSQSSFFDRVKD